MSDHSNFNIEGVYLVLKVNALLYPLEAIYSAAYVFLDKAYIILDGDPNSEILVKIKSKNGEDLEKLGNEFNNELINYSDYLVRAKKTQKLREMFLQRAIITNDPSMVETSEEEGLELEQEPSEDISDEIFLDDPEGIAIPWEEKYGSENSGEVKENENKSTL